MQGKNKEDSRREETRGEERVTAWLMKAKRWAGGRGHATKVKQEGIHMEKKDKECDITGKSCENPRKRSPVVRLQTKDQKEETLCK